MQPISGNTACALRAAANAESWKIENGLSARRLGLPGGRPASGNVFLGKRTLIGSRKTQSGKKPKEDFDSNKRLVGTLDPRTGLATHTLTLGGSNGALSCETGLSDHTWN